MIFFFNDTATTEIYTLSLHDALPISDPNRRRETGFPASAEPVLGNQSSGGRLSRKSSTQTPATASLGARQSPRGLSAPMDETLGPLGKALRLNCEKAKKRCVHSSDFTHRFILGDREVSCFKGRVTVGLAEF